MKYVLGRGLPSSEKLAKHCGNTENIATIEHVYGTAFN